MMHSMCLVMTGLTRSMPTTRSVVRMGMSPEVIQARLPREHGLLETPLLHPCLVQREGRQADLPVGCARRQPKA